jgi:hypothetical protein
MNIYESELISEVAGPARNYLKLKVVPLNGFGKIALFRSVSSEFQIIKGEEIVEIVRYDSKNSEFELKAKAGFSGLLAIKVKNNCSLMPETKEFLVKIGKFE